MKRPPMFFGSVGDGHCWYRAAQAANGYVMTPLRSPDQPSRIQYCVDGCFAPRDVQGNELPNGVAQLVQMGEIFGQFTGPFTLLSFWDNTGDKRPGSSSTFIVQGVFSFEQMINAIKLYFPKLWERFHFPITFYLPRSA